MRPYIRDKKVFGFDDVPENTCFEAGYLVTVNSGWRSIKNGKAAIDYDFCKGCGICAKICKPGAIETEAERK